MKIAFLDGARWSQGDFNARHKADRMRTMLTRARRVGLDDDPAKILQDELDAEKLDVMIYYQKQQRLLQGSQTHRFLLGANDDQEERAKAAIRASKRRLEDDSIYDSDEE